MEETTLLMRLPEMRENNRNVSHQSSTFTNTYSDQYTSPTNGQLRRFIINLVNRYYLMDCYMLLLFLSI